MISQIRFQFIVRLLPFLPGKGWVGWEGGEAFEPPSQFLKREPERTSIFREGVAGKEAVTFSGGLQFLYKK